MSKRIGIIEKTGASASNPYKLFIEDSVPKIIKVQFLDAKSP